MKAKPDTGWGMSHLLVLCRAASNCKLWNEERLVFVAGFLYAVNSFGC